MQSIINVENAIKDKDAYEDKLTSYVAELRLRSLEMHKEKLSELAEIRNMPLETLEKAGIFYIGEMAEMLIPTYLNDIKHFGVISPTNKKPIFHNRYVIPILTEEGKVQNLVGYSRDADERYIYGTAKYYRRKDTLYGLENLHIAYELGYAVLTEGITDTLRLRSLNIPNSFGNCGTHRSEYSLSQLNRCEYGIIRIPDRDSAGNEAKKGWITNKYLTLNPAMQYKDIDELIAREEGGEEWFMGYFKACVDILKSAKHNGQTFAPLEYTML